MTAPERILALLALAGKNALSESEISEICVIASNNLVPILFKLENNGAIIKARAGGLLNKYVYRIAD